ncbi:hypothetical protein AA313_de0205291 [Arthrobotrys entomopaga]|nr:hypothetical protein AA313_de0205291 [Arthrobotrys entomopaga]
MHHMRYDNKTHPDTTRFSPNLIVVTPLEFCLSSLDASCRSATVSGYYTPGTFQQYCLAAVNYVTPIPEGLPSELAAPLLCGGMTVWSALKKANIQPNQWVAIPGAGGGLGHLAIQFVKNSYKAKVIAIDTGAKEEFCRKLGAEAFFDFRKYTDEELAKAVKDIAGGAGAHVILITAGSQNSYDQAIELIRPGGKMICVGIPEGEETPIKGAVPSHIATKQKQIIGSALGSLQETAECLAAAEKGDAKVEVRVERLEKLGEVFSSPVTISAVLQILTFMRFLDIQRYGRRKAARKSCARSIVISIFEITKIQFSYLLIHINVNLT